jgi:chromosomal replication initiation ATPase DnaA
MTIYLQLIYSIKDDKKVIERLLIPFKKLIEIVKDKLNLSLDEAEITLLDSISFKIKVESESRGAIRKAFKKQVETIKENISDVCEEIRKKTKKDILIIIDDFDKLKDEVSTEKIFFKEAHMLTMPKTKIIFTFPLATYYSPGFVHITDKFSQKFIRLVNLYDIKKNYQEYSFAILKKMVLKRIDEELVSDEALKYLIDNSGGLLRDLIKFMQDACKIVIDRDLSIIDVDISKKVTRDKINEYNRLFDFPKYEGEVKKIIKTQNKDAVENKILIYLLRYLFVLEYGRQGEQSWYDVHPCLKDCLKK